MHSAINLSIECCPVRMLLSKLIKGCWQQIIQSKKAQIFSFCNTFLKPEIKGTPLKKKKWSTSLFPHTCFQSRPNSEEGKELAKKKWLMLLAEKSFVSSSSSFYLNSTDANKMFWQKLKTVLYFIFSIFFLCFYVHIFQNVWGNDANYRYLDSSQVYISLCCDSSPESARSLEFSRW